MPALSLNYLSAISLSILLLSACSAQTSSSDEESDREKSLLHNGLEAVKLPSAEELEEAADTVIGEGSALATELGGAVSDLSETMTTEDTDEGAAPSAPTSSGTSPSVPGDPVVPAPEPDAPSPSPPPSPAPPPPTPPPPSPTPEPEPTPTPPANGSGYIAALKLCPLNHINNAPPADGEVISPYSPFVIANGTVAVAVAPIEQGCLSSGYGQRFSGIHKGIDLHHGSPTEIYAAANGVVKARLYRDDYGNMIVIDHGNGVYTRYAHLQSFAADLSEGDAVSQGTRIGMMGNTASYSIPIHLHYEVLTGDWGVQAGSFALTPQNIFKLPAAN